MSTRLVKLEKVSRKNKHGKCDWKIELLVDGEWTEVQYWIKYTRESVIEKLRKTCNCVIPKELAR